MNLSWLVILPPLVVLLLSFLWQDVTKSLLVGIFTACLIAGKGQPTQIWQIFWTAFQDSVLDTQGIYIALFLFALGGVITIIDASGGAQRFSSFLAGYIRTAQGSQLASIATSLCLFIDDNLNTVTAGYVMYPLTDHFKVARAKLAFLIDSLAAPVTILVPLSSWVAMILRQYELSGISTQLEEHPIIVADSYYAYLRTIPFIFYSILAVVSVLYIVIFNISFGPMAKHEKIAAQTGNLFGGKEPLMIQHRALSHTGSIFDLILPIATLVVTVIVGLLWTGGYWLLGGTNSLIQTLQHANTYTVLLVAAILSLTVSIIIGLQRRVITRASTSTLVKQSFEVMRPAVVIITLAGMFSVLLKDHLQTGTFLANLATNHIGFAWFPAAIFVVSSVISITTGTSWGTIAVMLPIAVQMLAIGEVHTLTLSVDQLCIALPTIGAVLSGAIAGDHISPLSGTTIMSSASTGCYTMDHVITQIWYTIPVLIGSLVGFIIAGNLAACSHPNITLFISLSVAIGTCCLLLTIAHWLYKRHY